MNGSGGMVAMAAIVVAIAVLVTVLKVRADRARRAAYTAYASRHGLTYQERGADELFARLREDRPFGRGHSRSADDVLSGQWRGRSAVGFTYTYKVTTSNGKSSSTRVYHWQVAAIRLPCALPELEVRDEGIGGRIANALGFDDIEVESDAFNRRFRLTSTNARFGSAFVHPQVMQLMLARQQGIVRLDRDLLVQLVDSRPEPADLAASWDYLSDLADLVPAFVLADYGRRAG